MKTDFSNDKKHTHDLPKTAGTKLDFFADDTAIMTRSNKKAPVIRGLHGLKNLQN